MLDLEILFRIGVFVEKSMEWKIIFVCVLILTTILARVEGFVRLNDGSGKVFFNLIHSVVDHCGCSFLDFRNILCIIIS